MLPPGLDHYSPHHYGTLTLTPSHIHAPTFKIKTVQVLFYGSPAPCNHCILSYQYPSFKYPIVTNLWLFYQYLCEARFISLKLHDENKQQLQSEFELDLRQYEMILKGREDQLYKAIKFRDYYLQEKQSCVIVDKNRKQVGRIDVQLRIQFDPMINLAILQFKSNDPQKMPVPNEIPNISPSLEANIAHLKEEKYDDKIDQIGIEEDIDRMIAQINSQHYDPSKYLQPKHSQIQQNYDHLNIKQPTCQKPHYKAAFHQFLPEKHTTTHKPVYNIKQQCIINNTDPYTSILPNFINTQDNQCFKYSVGTQDIKDRKFSILGSSASPRMIQQGGAIRLRIHELAMQRPQKQAGFLLKVYLNQASCQFYSVNGVRQGQVVSFQSSLIIDQQFLINSLKFQLIDTIDLNTTVAVGVFQMNRIWSLNFAKGTFIVNLVSNKSNSAQPSKFIKTMDKNIVKVMPNFKNLRIQVQLKQKTEIVQMYLSLRQFDQNCRRCCYKIPMTKERIQFRVGQQINFRHINIFPHNRGGSTSHMIIVEFWTQTQLIGYNQICLKSLGQSILQTKSCLKPIKLLQQYRNVTDLLNNQNKGRFYVSLHCGTVGQIQSLINGQVQMQSKMPKRQIAVQNKLGIYIKENKGSKQVEIQVDQLQTEHQQSMKVSKKQSMNLNQQQQLLSDQQQDEEFYKYQQEQDKKPTNLFLQQKDVLNHKNSLNQQKLGQIQQSPVQKPIKRSSIIFGSLTKDFQIKIKQTLIGFTNDNLFQTLKQECNPKLLYNFILKEALMKILQKLGIKQQNVDYLLNEILMVTNGMINITILYDMIFGLILEQEVKQKYIDDYQLGKFCLRKVYTSLKSCHELQDFIFDNNTQFNEVKQLSQLMQYKITMREFDLMHKFTQKYIADVPETSYQNIKQMFQCQQISQKQIVAAQQNYSQQVLSKIYNFSWDEEDNYFISNINMHGFMGNNLMCNMHQSGQIGQDGQQGKFQSQKTEKRHCLGDKFLNETTINVSKSKQIVDTYIQSNTDNEIKNLSKNTQSHLISNLHIAQTKIADQGATYNYKLTLQGFQQCVQTIQCLLNQSIQCPKIAILSNAFSKPIQIIRKVGLTSYIVGLQLRGQEMLEGSLQLLQMEHLIARCNFSVMVNMKSCYSLKSVQKMQFCGILKLLLQPDGK